MRLFVSLSLLVYFVMILFEMIVSFFEYDFPGPADCNPDRIGLHVGEEGVITLAGKPFSGFGVNYFGAFAHYWYGDYEIQPFVEAFRKLKAYLDIESMEAELVLIDPKDKPSDQNQANIKAFCDRLAKG